MSESRRRVRRYTTIAALLAGGAATIASLAQTPNGKWWPGYGNGPDNSRYFASRQINKSNVNQLQVAWNYPLNPRTQHDISVSLTVVPADVRSMM